MDITILAELINAVGFPIAVSVGLYYMNISSLRQQREVLTKLELLIKDNTKALDTLYNELRSK